VSEVEYTKNLQSPAQFQRGDSLTVRANTVPEAVALMEEASKKPELAAFFPKAEVPKAPAVTVQDVTVDAPSDEEALVALKNIGATESKPATPAQIAVAAKKSGKSKEELAGISEADAKALIAGGKA
jgi:hypothetical protein